MVDIESQVKSVLSDGEGRLLGMIIMEADGSLDGRYSEVRKFLEECDDIERVDVDPDINTDLFDDMYKWRLKD